MHQQHVVEKIRHQLHFHPQKNCIWEKKCVTSPKSALDASAVSQQLINGRVILFFNINNLSAFEIFLKANFFFIVNHCLALRIFNKINLQ
jgi:hypothetical protein